MKVTAMDDTIYRRDAIDVARKCRVIEVTPAHMLIDKAEVMTELMMLPSAQPVDKDINVPNTDTISRQAALDALGEEPLVWHEDDAGEIAERNQWRRDVAAIKKLPSAQLESCEDAVFWRKRAEEYENQYIKLAAEIARNSKFDSVELNDKGIKFTMKQAEHRSLT